MPEIQALEMDLNKHTTLQYRAPEMCDAWARKPIGPPADIWALGVLLYKLCYYTTPFEDGGVLAIQNARYKFPPHPAYSSAIRELIGASFQARTILTMQARCCKSRRPRDPRSSRSTSASVGCAGPRRDQRLCVRPL